MVNVTLELIEEYRLVEKDVRERNKEVFDQIEQELLAKWTQVWTELGFDVSKVKVRVEPRITVSLEEAKDEPGTTD